MLSPEVIGAIAAGIGLVCTGLFTAVTTMLVKAARESRVDRQQFLEFIAKFVTASSTSSDGEVPNGRTKLLVEQTHGMTDRLEKAFEGMRSEMKRQTTILGNQTEILGRYGDELRRMRIHDADRLKMVETWKDDQLAVVQEIAKAIPAQERPV